MPFRSIRQPAIGISLLKAQLLRDGLQCDIRYFNFEFAKLVGLLRYEEIGSMPLIGEMLFARAYFAEGLPNHAAYLACLMDAGYGSKRKIEELLSLTELVPSYLNACMASVCWSDYDIVGFSSMFEQNVPSLALAQQIKEAHPDVVIVFGGANCEGDMGLELHRSFPVIDYVFSAEADLTFTEFVKRIKNHKTVSDIPGIIRRDGTESRLTALPQMVSDLEGLPYPNYDDYFDQLQAASIPFSECDEVLLETSRGCWWGEKSQCTFCGLNGGSIRYRSKTPARVLAEIRRMDEKYLRKYQVTKLGMVDNVLDKRYFDSVLPELARMHNPFSIFYEVRSNLSKKQVKALAEANILMIQPGIESINSHILKLMRKGVTSLQNLQLLKYCHEFGIYPVWSILIAFPGETADDYHKMIDLIAKVNHLPAPLTFTPFQLQRFSPYFINPERYGIRNIRAGSGYAFVYPFETESLERLAYHFEFDFSDEVKPPPLEEKLAAAIENWQQNYAENSGLYAFRSGSALTIEDQRPNAVARRTVLPEIEKTIYGHCDRIRGFPELFAHIRQQYCTLALRERDVRDFLNDMIEINYMVTENDRYLSLAVMVEAA